MTKGTEELLERYAEVFGDGFPTIPLAWGRSDDELAEIVQECLDKGKDAYELGLVEEGEIY